MEIIFYLAAYLYILYWLILSYYFFKKDTLSNCRKINPKLRNQPICSVIICMRNEEKYIEKCLKTLIFQKDIEKYAELILVDDASEDRSCEIANTILAQQNKLPYRIIQNNHPIGKKRCIEKGIKSTHPSTEWIILRDADTYTTTSEWFLNILNHLHKNPDLLIAPVITDTSRATLIEYFQYYEGIALMHLTYSSWKIQYPILCNGANLIFKKSKFEELNPYKDNYHLQTGDDIFILNSFKKNQKSILSAFENNNIVFTYSPISLNELLQQKTRWLSKTKEIKDLFNSLSVLIIGAFNLLFIPLIIYSFNLFILLFCIKMSVDFFIIYSVEKKLQIPHKISIYFVVAELLYIPYVWALIFKFILLSKKDDRNTHSE